MDINHSMEQLSDRIKTFIRPEQVLYEVAAQTLDEYTHLLHKESPNKKQLLSLEYQIHALKLLVESPKATSTAIQKKTSHLDYIDQHNILTRWAWMSFHYDNLYDKHKSKFPFECNLGEFHHWITEDYEYYVLLHFLPHLYKQTKTPYLFASKPIQKQFAPDFMVSHKRERMGIELTIAPEHEEFGRNQHCRSRFIDHITATYHAKPMQVSIVDVSRWFGCVKYKQDICMAIDLCWILKQCNKLVHQTVTFDSTTVTISPIDDHILLTIEGEKNEYNITLAIRDADQFDLIEDPEVQQLTKIDAAYQEEQCCLSIISRIHAKNEAQFEPNTILVIWPMNEFDTINYKKIANRLLKQSIETRFKEVWIFTKSGSYCIYKQQPPDTSNNSPVT
jgi:hypothetical protein